MRYIIKLSRFHSDGRETVKAMPMALLKILEYPDPRLRTRAAPVAAVDDRIRRLVADMLETMYAAPGVGLAATQVDVHLRVLVMDMSEDKGPAPGADQSRDPGNSTRWRDRRGGLPVGARLHRGGGARAPHPGARPGRPGQGH